MNAKRNMAKLLIILCLLAFVRSAPPADIPVTSASAQAQAPEVTAKSAIVIDAQTLKCLYEKDADRQRATASTTKLMTLLLACEKGDMDEIVTVPASAGTVPADSTRVPVYPGAKMPFKDLVYSMMIKSGNDAANAIGTLVSGSVASFVEVMNSRARSMGLENTHFMNPHGYPVEGHYSSARDLAKIAGAVINNSKAFSALKTRSYTMADGRTLKNAYAILDDDSQYYYRYALGGKTGYSLSSGQCFVCVAKKDDRTLISAVLYSGLSKGEKWTDTKALLEYGFGE